MTKRQELFCLEYIKDFNATQAAIRAGYSAQTAKQIGCENLTKPDISDRISDLCKELLEAPKEELKARIVNEYKAIAFARIGDVLNDDLSINEEQAKLSPAVRELSVELLSRRPAGESSDDEAMEQITMNHKIKMHDKLPALAALAKYTQLIKEDAPFDGEYTLLFKRKEDPKP